VPFPDHHPKFGKIPFPLLHITILGSDALTNIHMLLDTAYKTRNNTNMYQKLRH